MAIKGWYSLVVTCDNNCVTEITVIGSSCQDAVKLARSKGWKVTTGRVLCPECALDTQRRL